MVNKRRINPRPFSGRQKYIWMLPVILIAFISVRCGNFRDTGEVTGDLMTWHKVMVTFDGPWSEESADPNPFLDYRLEVTFRQGERVIKVPGYFAADGNAAVTSASGGNKWRVNFTPDAPGKWTYNASFRSGPNLAVSLDEDAGEPISFNGAKGKFVISPSDKQSPDFRSKGMLRYVGEHYLQHAGTKEYFIRIGTQSPENLFAYADFDGTKDWGSKPNNLVDGLHHYLPHVDDWNQDDETWQGGKGKGLIGALNYLSEKGINGVWSLTMNYKGDGSEIYPWVEPSKQVIYDCSKLDQWEIVLSHMDKKGILWHAVTQEEENDYLLDGYLSVQRKLYYRELIARFSHHLGVEWDLGEEIDRSGEHDTEDIKSYCRYITSLDPYDHPISAFNWPLTFETLYGPLLGFQDFHATGFQIVPSETNMRTKTWCDKSAEANHKWLVYVAEENPITTGVLTDSVDFWHDEMRKDVLWGNIMAGGAGVETFFGYKYPHNDMDSEDWRQRDHMWELLNYGSTFFQKNLPFWEMHSNNELTQDSTDFVFAQDDVVYVIYRYNGGGTKINLKQATGDFQLSWYNPRTGQFAGKATTIKGGMFVETGNPPQDIQKDWVVLIKRKSN